MYLSIVIATYNEEENLPSCLDSVKDLADEIIIVDGSSTDKTVEIAKKYGAKVLVTDNPPIFHINKQKAIDLATKDWVLQLDADERVSRGLKEEIGHLTNDHDRGSQLNGYWIPRKNWFLGRFLMKGGQYPDYTLRLYKKGKGRLPQKDVHEQAIVDGKTDYLKNPFLHYPYKSFLEYLFKWNRYTDLISDHILKDQLKKSFAERLFYGFFYLIIKPIHWFLLTYIRHKGFMDSWQGFVFSVFSALRFPFAYLKYLRLISF